MSAHSCGAIGRISLGTKDQWEAVMWGSNSIGILCQNSRQYIYIYLYIYSIASIVQKTTWSNQIKFDMHIHDTKLQYGYENHSVLM